MKQPNSSQKSRQLVQLALFSALILVMASVPFLGYVLLGFTRATILHLPVILGSILLGPKAGAVLGGLFGLTSLWSNTFQPVITSFVFSPFYSVGDVHGSWASLVICFVPRILTGIVPYYVFQAVRKLSKNPRSVLALGAAGFSGAMTNTLLVMHLIYLLFGQQYAALKATAGQGAYSVILSIIAINGIPEAVVAVILTILIGTPLLHYRKQG